MLTEKYKITSEQKREIEEARQKNKDKRVEAKLKALSLRADGFKAKAISEAKDSILLTSAHWFQSISTAGLKR